MTDDLSKAADAAEHALERALVRRGFISPHKSRAQRRAEASKRIGQGAGEGKHPIGGTAPLPSERARGRKPKRKAQRAARRRGR